MKWDDDSKKQFDDLYRICDVAGFKVDIIIDNDVILRSIILSKNGNMYEFIHSHINVLDQVFDFLYNKPFLTNTK